MSEEIEKQILQIVYSNVEPVKISWLGRQKEEQNENAKKFQHLDQCVFCEKTFYHQRLLLSHAASCDVIQSLERKRTCLYCNWEAAESECIAHEPICTKNPVKHKITLTCVNCDTFRYPKKLKNSKNLLNHHLVAGCLPFLKQCTETSMKETCQWNQNSDTTLAKPNSDSDSKLFRIKKDFTEISTRWKPQDHFECIYCTETFRFYQYLQRHMTQCEGFQRRQPIRLCRFCQTSMREFKSYLHEANCNMGPKAYHVSCVSCQKKIPVKNKCTNAYRDHLLSCLDICLDYAQEVIDEYRKREDFKQKVLDFAFKQETD